MENQIYLHAVNIHQRRNTSPIWTSFTDILFHMTTQAMVACQYYLHVAINKCFCYLNDRGMRRKFRVGNSFIFCL